MEYMSEKEQIEICVRAIDAHTHKWGDRDGIYVGRTSDYGKQMGKNKALYGWRWGLKAPSAKVARLVEERLHKLGYVGDGGGPDEAMYIYVYRIIPGKTKE